MKWWFSVWILKENTMSTNFEPLEWVSFVKSTKIGTQKNKAIHSNLKCHKTVNNINGHKDLHYYVFIHTKSQFIKLFPPFQKLFVDTWSAQNDCVTLCSYKYNLYLMCADMDFAWFYAVDILFIQTNCHCFRCEGTCTLKFHSDYVKLFEKLCKIKILQARI